ncbi:MAG: D-alanine--D-alanine ligase [Candidatus Moranbacteria bacterium]|nr:D-alanine--D-alanine ligase [Candidatus Moranbacteria bacterium]
MKKLRVGVLFGGKSTEHEVSLWSAKNVIANLDREKFEPVLIAIDKEGQWFLPQSNHFLLESENTAGTMVQAEGEQSTTLLPGNRGGLVSSDMKASAPLDVVFPVLHGGYGEDGTVQGLLKLSGLPFVGAGVLGSAVGMDKDVMKRLLRDAGIAVAKFIVVRERTTPGYDQVVETLGTPFFVKPANAGSSVGVHRVQDAIGYTTALKDAFLYDTKVLIEEAIVGREIEVAVLGNEDLQASVPGEVVPTRDFYSYEAKYLDESGARIEIPAQLPEETVKRLRELACQAFSTLSCEGLGRVDFFLRENGDILVNEINTLPGFTAVSMYPKLWEASGMTYTALITRLIGLALERHEREQRLQTSYQSGE